MNRNNLGQFIKGMTPWNKGKFGYAQFGDFFFQGMSMYVFPRRNATDKTDVIEDDSARGCAIDFLHDECWNRPCPQKVIFAGVRTPFTDSNGESIYTGDVIKIDDGFQCSGGKMQG